MTTYQNFLEQKIKVAPKTGFDVDPDSLHPVLFPHQRDIVTWSLKGGCRAVFASFGLGKCHGIDTPILMYDGTIKMVQDVQVGDRLMGDNSTPRIVLSLARGREMMYRITLKNGDSFTCNESHILSLKVSNGYGPYRMGEIVNMPLTEYLALPEYAKKNCFKHYKAAVAFKTQPVPMDPYLFGTWLGDGHRRMLTWTIGDKDTAIADRIIDFAASKGLTVRVSRARGCSSFFLTRTIRGRASHVAEYDFIRQFDNEKRIDQRYLQNSRAVRLQVLAGLIDTDGHLIDKCYEIATKWQGLRDDILYLCRSLGFSVKSSLKVVNGVAYHRIFISGETSLIPCITRKACDARRQIKNPLVYGFTVEKLEEGDYYGFTIDGNHLYLLGDFTVTHNTLMQLETLRQITIRRPGCRVLIVCPLGVRQEFARDGRMLGVNHIQYIASTSDLTGDQPFYITNYERIRRGAIDPELFTAVCFDEASILRSLSTDTTQTILDTFAQVEFRFVHTATPAPNRYLELINYGEYLGIMDRGQALTRFFERDSTTAGNLTLYPRREREFWHWMASWAAFVTRPSDLGYDDTGYDLPELTVNHHRISFERPVSVDKKTGMAAMFTDSSKSLQEAAKEKKRSIPHRIAKLAELYQPGPQSVIWCDLNDEQKAIEKMLREKGVSYVSLYGSEDADKRERAIEAWKDGKAEAFLSKPSMYGSGLNMQQSSRMYFSGITYKFQEFIQAIHRIYRFGQTSTCQVEVIYTDAEDEILKVLLQKWTNHNTLQTEMTDIIKTHGLNADLMQQLKRDMFTGRREASGHMWTSVNNDCVAEFSTLDSDSLGLILTSIPFGNHYEYSENYNCFGHNEDNEAFFRQMDFLVPHLYRTLQPGRIAAIHVKDRLRYSYMNGTGFSSIDPFSDDTTACFRRHGFHLMSRITVDTDVVRENNGSYRLSWSEACKDMTKMGAGLPEYVLVFRKPPTTSDNAYADVPVVHSKEKYSVARWQLDAHAHWKTSGERLLSSERLRKLDLGEITKLWAMIDTSERYDYNRHVQLAEQLDSIDRLPKTFMVIPPQSNSPDIWDDVSRMKTLNLNQAQKGSEKHICPLQLDIIERLIERYSNPGDVVADPFGGIGSVPYQAVKMGRRGFATELNTEYWSDGLKHLKAAEAGAGALTLFDMI